MQLNPSYLYSNRVDVYTNLGTWTKERYRKVYQRNLKLYRGVDNRLDFQIKNGEERPQPISNLTIVFNIVGVESNELLVQQNCTIHDAVLGRFFATVGEAAMEQLLPGHYHYSLYTVNAAGVKSPMYADSQYGVTGTIDVIGDAYGGPRPSAEPTNVFTALDAKPQFNSNAGLHTFAFYTTDFVGDITIEGSLDENLGSWVDVDTISLDSTPVGYLNVTGVWSRLRVKQLTNHTGTLDKVLYRY